MSHFTNEPSVNPNTVLCCQMELYHLQLFFFKQMSLFTDLIDVRNIMLWKNTAMSLINPPGRDSYLSVKQYSVLPALP